MIQLGVNIDHIATIRQARRTFEPDPVTAAALAVLGGADIITVHLREDRRHIQDRDVRLLRETIFTKLNLEMSTASEIVDIAIKRFKDAGILVSLFIDPEENQIAASKDAGAQYIELHTGNYANAKDTTT